MLHPATDGEFTQSISSLPPDSLVVIDFFATWCGPCKAIAPEFERMSVDGDKCKLTCMTYGVRAYPTLVLLKNKSVLAKFEGGKMRELALAIDQNRIVIPPKPELSYRHFPLKGYLYIDTPAKFEPIMKKLLDINGSKTSGNLKEGDINMLKEYISVLEKTGYYHTSEVSKEVVYILHHVIRDWKDEECFPAMDLLVAGLRHPSTGYILTPLVVPLITNVLSRAVISHVFAFKLLSMRLVLNLLSDSNTRQIFVSNMISAGLINVMVKLCEEDNKSLKSTLSFIYHNLCVYVFDARKKSLKEEREMEPNLEVRENICNMLPVLIQHENIESNVTRYAKSIGTLVMEDAELITGEVFTTVLKSLHEAHMKLIPTQSDYTEVRETIEDIVKELDRVLHSLE